MFGSPQGGLGAAGAPSGAAVDANANILPSPPSDSLSRVAWFPGVEGSKSFLAAASWDRTCRAYEVTLPPATVTGKNVSGQTSAGVRAVFAHDAPLLCCAFSRQGVIFAGGADGAVKAFNLATAPAPAAAGGAFGAAGAFGGAAGGAGAAAAGTPGTLIGKHDSGVSGISFSEEKNALITSSWDQSVRFWDCRQAPTASAALTVKLPSKVLGLDVRQHVAVCFTNDRGVHTIDLNNPQQTPRRFDTLLRLQLTTVRILPNMKGVLVGSIEGRVNTISFVSQAKEENFAFRCHREEVANQRTLVYPVHCIDVHPRTETVLLTAGGDGGIATWDIARRQRLSEVSKGAPGKPAVVDARFDPTGRLVACARSYDWVKGVHKAAANNHVSLTLLNASA